MQYKFYTIYDSQTESYGRPFMARTDGDATRTLRNEVNSTQGGLLNTHPADYMLYNIGQYDDETGELIGHKAHTQVCRLDALKDSNK